MPKIIVLDSANKAWLEQVRTQGRPDSQWVLAVQKTFSLDIGLRKGFFIKL